MPTPTDHYHEAERLLDRVEAGGGDDTERREWLLAANAHAALAAVAPRTSTGSLPPYRWLPGEKGQP